MHWRLALPLVGILALVSAVAFLALSSAAGTAENGAVPDGDVPVTRTATFALG